MICRTKVRSARVFAVAVLFVAAIVSLPLWGPEARLTGLAAVPARSLEHVDYVNTLDSASVIRTAITTTVYLPIVTGRHSPAPHPSPFGIQLYGSLTEEANAMSLVQASQAFWIRWPISWRSIEPQNTAPADFLWTSTDLNVGRAVDSGHRVILTTAAAPEWAAPYLQGYIYPEKIPDFAEFVAALAERYDGDGDRDAPGSPVVKHIELFNEPDSSNVDAAEAGYHSYWGPYGDLYAAMLCDVYDAVKATSPQTKVVLGGLAFDNFLFEGGSFNPEFLDDVLAAGGGSCFDVMNFHYYPVFEGRWYPYGYGVSGKAAFLAAKLAAYGRVNVPTVVTEAGWRSDQPEPGEKPGTPDIQSSYVVQLFAQAAASDLETLIWWSWIDIGWPHGNMGLITQAFDPKPSHTAYRVAADKIGRAQFQQVVPTPPGLECYRFTSASGLPLYVVYPNDDQPHSIAIPLVMAKVTDMYGTVIGQLVDGDGDGHVVVTMDDAFPRYVEAVP